MVVKPYRKRYILFEIISNKEIKSGFIKEAIFQSIYNLIGALGLSRANVKFLDGFWEKNRGVLCIDHRYVPEIKTSLSLIKKIGNQEVIIKSIKVFGTLKKIKKLYKEVE